MSTHCSSAGCDRPILARGMCSACYERDRRDRKLTRGATTQTAFVFGQWTPQPTLYGGVSDKAVRYWFSDCPTCRWTRAARDEDHAQKLAEAHNMLVHS